MTKKTKVPIPLNRWFSDIKSIEELRALLDSDSYQQAVAILKDSASPNHASLTLNPEANSQRFAWLAGYRDAFADLERLTQLPTTKTTNTTDEWMHLSNQ
jgi:hypothetical protein